MEHGTGRSICVPSKQISEIPNGVHAAVSHPKIAPSEDEKGGNER